MKIINKISTESRAVKEYKIKIAMSFVLSVKYIDIKDKASIVDDKKITKLESPVRNLTSQSSSILFSGFMILKIKR